MRTILIAALSAAALVLGAACATTPEEQVPAGVEDRTKPGAPGKPGADTRTVQPPKVAPVDIGSAKPDARGILKDPSSILSKRSIYYDFDKFDIKDEYRPLVEAHAK